MPNKGCKVPKLGRSALFWAVTCVFWPIFGHSATTTPRTGMVIPAFGDQNWDVQMRANFNIIDSSMCVQKLSNVFTASQTLNTTFDPALTLDNEAAGASSTTIKWCGATGCVSPVYFGHATNQSPFGDLLNATGLGFFDVNENEYARFDATNGLTEKILLKNQFVQTNSSRSLTSYDLFNASPTYNGQASWTSAKPSTFTAITITSATITSLNGATPILSTSSLQFGATFYVSSGTVGGNFAATGTVVLSSNVIMGSIGNSVTISSNAVMPGATFYQGGNVQMGVPGQSVSVSSNAVLPGATFYQNAVSAISTISIGSLTGGGLGTCGDGNHAIGYTSTGTFQCQALTANLVVASGTTGNFVTLTNPTTNVIFDSTTLTVTAPFANTALITANGRITQKAVIAIATGTFVTTATSMVNISSMVVTITPTSPASCVHVHAVGVSENQAGGKNCYYTLTQNGTNIAISAGSNAHFAEDFASVSNSSIHTVVVDVSTCPFTTAALTYQLQFDVDSAGQCQFGDGGSQNLYMEAINYQ